MPRCALYLRSSKDRHDVSIDAQRRALLELEREAPPSLGSDLWQVWIDCNMGIISPSDWAENSDPQQLAPALDEAAECRRLGYPTRIQPVPT